MKPTDTKAREALAHTQAPVADTTELTAIPSTRIANLAMIAVGSPKSIYIWDNEDTATPDPGSVEVPDDVAASAAYIDDPTTAPGRWTNIYSLAAGAQGAGAASATFRVLGATTANLSYTLDGNTLEADANGAQGAIDGVTFTVGKVILVKNQSATEANGLYGFTSMGGASAKASMDRIPGFDSDAEALAGTSAFVSQGTVNGNQIWDLTTDDPITLGTTGLTFTKRPTLAELASTSAGKGSALIGSEDAGGFTANTTVETQLQEIYQDLKSAQASMPINIYSFREVSSGGDVGDVAANGGVLASDTTPIMLGDANGSAAIQWATGNADPIGTSFMLPSDFDDTGDAAIVMVVSSGSTDAASLVAATSWNGGSEVTDSADDSGTKSATPHTVSAAIATADIPVGANRVTIRLTPPAHAANAISLYAVRLDYKRKPRTS